MVKITVVRLYNLYEVFIMYVSIVFKKKVYINKFDISFTMVIEVYDKINWFNFLFVIESVSNINEYWNFHTSETDHRYY